MTLIRNTLATVLLMAGLAMGGEGKPTHVFLLMGQSNMAGRAKPDQEDAKPIEGVLLLNGKGEWEAATHPLNKYGPDSKKPQVGPGGDFARALREARKNMVVGLVVHARGATSIEQWGAEGNLYTGAIARVKAANLKVAGVLWHQGEHNDSDANYAEKLAELVARTRKDLGDPDLPFVCGEICSPGATVNRQMHACAEKVKGVAVARAENLKKFDAFHFDRASVKTLGERYAEAWLQLVPDKAGK
jgi:hypothetical protein